MVEAHEEEMKAQPRKDRIRVGFVTPEFLDDDGLFPGGLASYVFHMSRALTDQGHSATVFMLSDRDAETDYRGIRVVKVSGRTPIPVKPLAWLFAKWLPVSVNTILSSWCLNRHISKTREKEGIDVLQYTNYKAVGLFRLKQGSLIRISSYQRLWNNNPKDRSLDKLLYEQLESIAIKRFSTVVGPGEHLAGIIRRDLHLPREIRMVPTPLGSGTRPSGRVFRPAGMRMVMYAGTVNRIKGSELLLGIIRKYLSEFDDTVFLLAGKTGRIDGRSLAPDLQSLSKDFPNRFIYHHHLEKPDLLAAYRQADVVLIPSLIDNFPNTALEAASQDALLIASKTASLGSLIRDGENGFVMDSRSTEEWVQAIRMALAIEPDRRERMKENMRAALVRHEPKSAALALCKVYGEVMMESEG
jgi:glycosyltransferase involved in cell wall biosynthesis